MFGRFRAGGPPEFARYLLPLGSVAIIIVLWQALVTGLEIPEIILPPPGRVWTSILANGRTLSEGALATGIRIVLGFVASALIALPLALLVTEFRLLGRIIEPLTTLSQSVPKLALAPLVVIWFGNGTTSQVSFAALIAFFPVFIETVAGLRALEPEMLLLARSMGSSRSQIILKFKLPGALPLIFAGFKIGATLAVVGAIVAEWIGGQDGIALILLQADALLDTPLAIAALLILSAMGAGFYLVIAVLEITVTPGRHAQPDTMATAT